ncbi:hypothetical protein CAL26_08550 [Bordetella genomosp. 9]|uniref:AB hydrolase-1 domain-containing protein n=1 Tax=Bordetella genomosp. 9 TaxID=1416803 RepID=A0A261REN1_9BORD|nr:hypothetical protein [Bordetella genomosp. 9]OZI23484.1 hypothetical protein CAL26_08550 [Bordetella genomosp. 9]
MRLVFCLLLALCAAASARAQDDSGPPRAPAPAWQTVQLGAHGHRYPFPVYASRPLTAANLAHVTHVVVILHGVKRDADHYYQTAAGLLETNPGAMEDTLVIAPKFAAPIDRGFERMPAWHKDRWIAGGDSVKASGRPAPIGSFEVLDDLLEWLSDRHDLPALRGVVLAGHSAGAQMLQRYAVLNNVDETIRKRGVTLRYVVANPSSYLYLTTDRPRGDGGYGPYNRGLCPDFNDFRYGLDHLPQDLRVADPKRLPARYAQRDVTYLLGGADTNPEHRWLDKRCGAEAQGATRLARGRAYVGYEAWLPALKQNVHQAYEVAGVGHNQRGMFGSQCGASALLGPDAKAGPEAATCTRITAQPAAKARAAPGR